jgi:Protein of unknown function (DUF995)
MKKLVLFAISMMVCTFAAGQVLTLADVKAKNAVQLSAADLQQLLPGATVINQSTRGSTRRWKNSPSGDFVASTQGEPGFPAGHTFSGSGTWKIDDKGMYCVQINWVKPMGPEDWCRYIFKSGDKYYAFDTLEDTAQTSEFGFSK